MVALTTAKLLGHANFQPFPSQGGHAGKKKSRTWGLAKTNETELRAVLFELDPTGSQANKKKKKEKRK